MNTDRLRSAANALCGLDVAADAHRSDSARRNREYRHVVRGIARGKTWGDISALHREVMVLDELAASVRRIAGMEIDPVKFRHWNTKAAAYAARMDLVQAAKRLLLAESLTETKPAELYIDGRLIPEQILDCPDETKPAELCRGGESADSQRDRDAIAEAAAAEGRAADIRDAIRAGMEALR